MWKSLTGLCLLFLLATPAWAQPAFPVGEFNLPADCGPQHTLRIPLTGVSSQQYGGEGLSILHAEFEGTQESALAEAASVDWGEVVDGSYRSLRLRVDCRLMRRAGSYRFLIYFPGLGDASAAQQFLTLKRPAAAIHLPAELRLEQSCFLPGPLLCRGNLGRSFSVSETTGASQISDLQVQPDVELKDESFAYLHAEVNNQGDVLIPAGGSGFVDLSLSGEIPLGTTRGTLRLKAPQLGAWQSLEVVARQRLKRWNIGLFVFLGLLGSLLLKVYLKNRLQLAEAQNAAAQLLEQVQDVHKRYADPKVRQAIEKSQRELATALDSRNAETIEAEVKSSKKALEAALLDWRTRRQELLPKIDNLRRIVETDWDIPASLSQALAAPGEPLQKAEALLNEGDVSGAGDKIDKAGEALLRGLLHDLREWMSHSRALCDQIIENYPAVPARGREDLKPHVAQFEEALSALDLDALKEPHQVPELLSKVETARQKLTWVCQEAATKAQGQAEEVSALLAETKDRWDHPEALRDALATLSAFCRQASSGTQDPEESRALLSAASRQVESQWDLALQAQGVDPSTYRDALQEGDVAKALRLALKSPVVVDHADDVALSMERAGPRGSLGMTIPFLQVSRPSRSRGSALPFFASLVLAAPGERFSPGALKIEARKVIWRSKIYQTLLIFLIFTLWGIWFFWDGFVGDFQQFAQIFFWAFGLDITVDRLLEVTRNKPGKAFAQ